MTELYMKKYTIHENLNTSFVDLRALVGFLGELQFVGSIHVELSSYDADIMFNDAGNVLAREYDHITGKSSYGIGALESIYRRAEEPRGRIHVYQGGAAIFTRDLSEIFVDATIAAEARSNIGNLSDTRVTSFDSSRMRILSPEETFDLDDDVFDLAAEAPELPDLPYVLRKAADEANAGPKLPSQKEWNELLDLTAELLRTIEASLKCPDFNFAEAFANAAAFVSVEYPFLDRRNGGLKYNEGWLSIGTRIETDKFVDGIGEVLHRMFLRMREESRFGKPLHWTTHRVRVLMQMRRKLYEKFGLENRLEQIIG